MNRFWSLTPLCAVLCAVLLTGCVRLRRFAFRKHRPRPADRAELLYREQRAAAVVIENTTDSTTQWGIGRASVVLEALTESGSSTELCLVYPGLAGHAHGRPGHARAGLILAAAQRAAGAAGPVRQQRIRQAVSGILQSPRGGRAGGGVQRLCQHRLQLEQHAPVAHQRQGRFLGAGQPEHLLPA